MALNKLFFHFSLLIMFTNVYSQQTTEQYSFILKVYKENGKNYVNADFVQYLIGDKAVEEAKKNGDADAFIVDGKKIYAVPNDFYIVNKNKTIRKIELSDNPKFNLLISENLNGLNTFENFKKNFHDTLYVLCLKNDKIIEVKEVFIP